MTEEERTTEDAPEQPEVGEVGQDSEPRQKSAKDRVEDGIREGMGVLSAFKEAVEETIQEAKERGDLSAEKAKEAVREALEKAQAAGERARERLDFVPHGDVHRLSDALQGLAERVAKLEESVFGASQAPAETEDEAGAEAGGGDATDEEDDGTGS